MAASDSELLHQFAREHREDAFAELVRRRIDFVYASALRQLAGDAHRAEDVTQLVFIDLARKAAQLARHPDLLGWLHTSTRFAAVNIIRSEQRRKRREEAAHAMHDPATSSVPESAWEQLRPVLDSALHELDARDRQAVLLRFFDRQPFAAIGARLGLSENAAQKRLERALDRLQASLARHGVSSTAGGIALALAQQSAAAAPAGLAASVAGTAIHSAWAIAPASGGLGFLTLMSTAKITSGVLAVVAVLAIGVALHERHTAQAVATRLFAAEEARAALQARLQAAVAQLATAEKRADAAEADAGALIDAVADLRTAQAAAAAANAKAAEAAKARATDLRTITAFLDSMENSVKSRSGYKPFEPVDESQLTEAQRQQVAEGRMIMQAQGGRYFITRWEGGFLHSAHVRPLNHPNEPFTRQYPNLTPADWVALNERYFRIEADGLQARARKR